MAMVLCKYCNKPLTRVTVGNIIMYRHKGGSAECPKN